MFENSLLSAPESTLRMGSMDGGKSILIVEDEGDLADMIQLHLRKEGYVCRVAGDGQQALAEVQRRPPDLIVLDRMLPKLPGEEVAKRLKSEARTSNIPIVMLTAKSEETDELVGFALGADDYIRKPFSMKVLLSRVAAILRRQESRADPSEVLAGGPLVLDRGRHEVRVDGESVTLTATEFRVLAALMAARGRVLARDQLIDAVLGYGVGVTNRTIDVHVAALRKKLLHAAGWIQTIRGVGYAFRAPTTGDGGE
jgi:two-component system, OmpR family, alkaline phosphatase synthesis response regulator PhoP